MALGFIAPDATDLPTSGALLLGERARILRLRRKGAVSANGSCHLFECLDGRIAINLAREDDRELLPALLHCEPETDEAALSSLFARHYRADMLARGVELGMAIAADVPVTGVHQWFAASCRRYRAKPAHSPRVLDFSSLWAGPLAGSLLAMMGAEVVKVESLTRPDGGRLANEDFFNLLNGMKQQGTIDFQDRERLRDLVFSADIIIEASRPNALRRIGILAEQFIAQGGLWIGITGHGRLPPHDRRVAFGDDAAVEAGLVHAMKLGWDTALFAGDAIADPMTGIHAALATWHFWSQGVSALVDISLCGTMRHAMSLGLCSTEQLSHWQALAEEDGAPLYPQRLPVVTATNEMHQDVREQDGARDKSEREWISTAKWRS
ncbi:CoA transferase [Sphingobium sp. SCG-1]|uniref:CoA transferase n=1 Tax=Sphingobium sp. SCG-1 TaxID=2072936 RepID=UPI001CB8F193|nr:CoA transferase [Sphingobium sp. SCG-1]